MSIRSWMAGAVVGLALVGAAAERTVVYWPFGINGFRDVAGDAHDLHASSVTLLDGGAGLDGNFQGFCTRAALDLRGCTSGMTCEFFVRLHSGATSTEQSVLISFTSDPIGNALLGGFMVCTLGDGVVAGVQAPYGGNYIGLGATPTSNLNDGAWHHVALVWSSAGTMGLYLDKVLQGDWVSVGAPTLRKAFLYLGSYGNDANRSIYDLDDVRISDFAMEPLEFLQNRTDDVSDSVLGYWTFDRANPLANGLGSAPALAATAVTCVDGVAQLDGTASLCASVDLASCTDLTIEWCARKASEEQGQNGTLLRLGDPSLAGGFALAASVLPADGAWHRFALVRTGTTLKFFVDGVEISPGVAFTGDGGGTLQTADLVLGENFVGELDDVRVTAAAVSPRRFIASQTPDVPQTIAYWSFNDENLYADQTGTFDLGAESVTTAFAADGAIHFDGSAALHSADAVPLDIFTSYTVECMVRYTNICTIGVIVQHSRDSNNTAGAFQLSTGGMGDNRASVAFKTGGDYNMRGFAEPFAGDGEWHHLVYTVDRSSGSLQTSFAVDGVEQPFLLADSWTRDTADTAFAKKQRIYMGCGVETTVLTWAGYCPFVGDVDDVRISEGVLPPEKRLSVATRTAGTPATVLAHWKFDEADPLVDKSGNGHALEGTATLEADGAHFDGMQYLQTVDPIACAPYRYITAEIVFKTPGSGREVDADQSLLEYGANLWEESAGAFALFLSADGRANGGTTLAYRGNGSAPLANNTWQRLALTIDVTRGDGVQLWDGTGSINGYLAGLGWTALGSFGDPRKLFIGTRFSQSLGGYCYGMRGVVKEVRLSTGPRTNAELLHLPSADNAVVAYWPFTPGRHLEDATGNGFDFNANVAGVASDPANSCLYMSSGHGLLQTVRALPLYLYNQLTVECWLKTENSDVAYVFASGSNGVEGQFEAWLVSVEGALRAGGALQGGLLYTSAGWFFKQNSDSSNATSPSFSDGQWHHLAMVLDREREDEDCSRIYVDGVQLPSGEDVYRFKGSFRSDVFTLGGRVVNDVSYAGLIDDVRITAAALSPEQFLKSRSKATAVTIYVR